MTEWMELSKQSFICIYSQSPSHELPPKLCLLWFCTALHSHKSANLTVNSVCEGSRLPTPYENHLETIPRHLSQSVEKLSFTKPVPGAKKVGDFCSTLYVIREMQMNTIRSTIRLLEWPKFGTDITRGWWDCGATGTHSLLVGMQDDTITSEGGLVVFLLK